MHRSSTRSLPVLLGVFALLVPTALLAGACGGSTETEPPETAGGAGGVAGAAGVAGSAGAAGAAAGAAGAAGTAGAAGVAEGGSGGAAGKAGAAGTAGKAGGAGKAGSGGAPGNECSACIEAKCADAIAACDTDEVCKDNRTCILEQCTSAASAGELITCATQNCGVGIPPSQQLLAIVDCTNKQCNGGECPFVQGAGGNGGAGGDPGAEAGVINCGDKACSADQGECCIDASFSGLAYSCKEKKACTGSLANVTLPCDGPEDCQNGQICCAQGALPNINVACSDTCEAPPNGQALTFCHKDDDCQAPETCQLCEIGQFGISITLRLCGEQCPGNGG